MFRVKIYIVTVENEDGFSIAGVFLTRDAATTFATRCNGRVSKHIAVKSAGEKQ